MSRETLAVSVLVHEQQDCVVDLLRNLRHFLGDPLVVMHVSRRFVAQGFDAALLREFDRVLINPEHVDTRWGDSSVLFAQLSNLAYLGREADYEHVVLDASNDLYVRHGAPAHLAAYDAGVDRGPLPVNTSHYSPAARNDEGLWRMRAHLGGVMAYVSGHEGAFFRRALVDEMVPLVERFARMSIRPAGRIGDPEGDYGKEEYYLPTAAIALAGSLGWPLIYRDWHNAPSLPMSSLEAVIEGDESQLQFYIGGLNFGVKRVARQIDDPVRRAVRALL